MTNHNERPDIDKVLFWIWVCVVVTTATIGLVTQPDLGFAIFSVTTTILWVAAYKDKNNPRGQGALDKIFEVLRIGFAFLGLFVAARYVYQWIRHW